MDYLDRLDRVVSAASTPRARHACAIVSSLGLYGALARAGLAPFSWQACALAPVTLLLYALWARVPPAWWAWRARHAAATAPAPPAVLDCVAAEMLEVAPYLDLLKQQLAGSLSVTEEGMMGLVGSLNAIHAMSHEQLSRIQAAEQNGAALSAVVSEKIMVDEQMVLILEMFVTRQEQDIAANLTRMQRLQDVKSLEPMIEIIADVAQQTNLMSINAAILAAHAGEQGRAFGVLASAIRELSHRTAQSTRDISRTIAAATADLDQEMQAVSRVGERQSAIGNMRKVVADIRGMQTRFGDASHRMLDILERDKSGHAHLVHHLSEAMGQVQVQDILRQRVEHVEAALTELQEHAQDLAVRMRQPVWDGAGMTGLRARLDAHLDSYVMQSQRVLHQQVTGAAEAEASERPAIELF